MYITYIYNYYYIYGNNNVTNLRCYNYYGTSIDLHELSKNDQSNIVSKQSGSILDLIALTYSSLAVNVSYIKWNVIRQTRRP